MTNKSVVNIGGGSYFHKSLYEIQHQHHEEKTAEEILSGLIESGAVKVKE